MLTPAVFTRRFGVKAPDVSASPRLAALRFATDNVSARRRCLSRPELPIFAGNATVVGSGDGMGAVLVFEAAAREAR